MTEHFFGRWIKFLDDHAFVHNNDGVQGIIDYHVGERLGLRLHIRNTHIDFSQTLPDGDGFFSAGVIAACPTVFLIGFAEFGSFGKDLANFNFTGLLQYYWGCCVLAFKPIRGDRKIKAVIYRMAGKFNNLGPAYRGAVLPWKARTADAAAITGQGFDEPG